MAVQRGCQRGLVKIAINIDNPLTSQPLTNMISFKQFLLESTDFDEPTHDHNTADALTPKIIARAYVLCKILSRTGNQLRHIMDKNGVGGSYSDLVLTYGTATDQSPDDVKQLYECNAYVAHMIESLATNRKISTKDVNEAIKHPATRLVRIHMQSVPQKIRSQVIGIINTNVGAEAMLDALMPTVMQHARDWAKAKNKTDAERRAAAKAQRDSVIPDDVIDQVKPHLLASTNRITLTSPRDPSTQIILTNPADVQEVFERYAIAMRKSEMLWDPQFAQQKAASRKEFESRITQYDGDLEQSNLFGMLKLAKMGQASAKLKTILATIKTVIGSVKWRVIYTYVPGGISGLGNTPYMRFTLISSNGLVALSDRFVVLGFTAGKSIYRAPFGRVIDFLNEPLPRVNKPLYKTILTDLR